MRSLKYTIVVVISIMVLSCGGRGKAPRGFSGGDRIDLDFVSEQQKAELVFLNASSARFLGSGINIDFDYSTQNKGESTIIINGDISRGRGNLTIRLTFNSDNKTGIARCTLLEPGKVDSSMSARFTFINASG